MAIKALSLTCDYCYSEEEVRFDIDLEPDEFVSANPVPENWWHVEGEGEEKDYCSRECLRSDL